ncbi:acyl-CoA thioesterase [Lactobacillus sp. PV034]|uniref:acyl-CoA thioesterase n=1 Tax=Lactobacillus sp. PV034 TaxID=2594495 RepID=UPI00223F0658|nr:hotdog domain-containing protein [Lactobacillus sp. PV034]QNQ80856.1 acyl-CoA thioesterase [Lactobacillus sp. PV034]
MNTIKCNDTLVVSNHLVLNSDLNEHETVYGGRILELVDGQASIAASRVARSRLATAALDKIQFLQPFKLGDSMCLEAYVTGFGKRSIEVFVKIIGEHLLTGERFLGFYCFMIFVILDPMKRVNYEKLIAETKEQKKLTGLYSKRMEVRKNERRRQEGFLSDISLDKPW